MKAGTVLKTENSGECFSAKIAVTRPRVILFSSFYLDEITGMM